MSHILKIGSQNWFFKVILSIDFFFERTLIELKELNLSWLSLEGLNFCWKYDSKNWTFFFSTWLKELFLPFFFWFKYLDVFHMTQRIELSFLRDSNTWTFLTIFIKEMDPFFQDSKFFHQKKKTHRIDFFLNPTHRIDFFCELNRLISWIWRKELNRLISWIWRKNLNPFSKYHSKNCFFLIRLKELNFLMNMT